jgi:hypothetical protein
MWMTVDVEEMLVVVVVGDEVTGLIAEIAVGTNA